MIKIILTVTESNQGIELVAESENKKSTYLEGAVSEAIKKLFDDGLFNSVCRQIVEDYKNSAQPPRPADWRK